MQFIRASKDSVLKPLQTVAGIVERRHTLPILANVLLRKDAENVSFLASDVEIQIQTTSTLGPGKDSGATTLSAKKLLDILRALPDGVARKGAGVFQTLWEVAHKESIGIVLGATAALVTTWYAAYRRRRREMSEINRGQ